MQTTSVNYDATHSATDFNTCGALTRRKYNMKNKKLNVFHEKVKFLFEENEDDE